MFCLRQGHCNGLYVFGGVGVQFSVYVLCVCGWFGDSEFGIVEREDLKGIFLILFGGGKGQCMYSKMILIVKYHC